MNRDASPEATGAPCGGNIAVKVARKNGGLVTYDGLCGELADDVLHEVGDASRAAILYVENLPFHDWNWHTVAVVDGVVHDAWHPKVMLAPEEYVRNVFGDEATFEVFGSEGEEQHKAADAAEKAKKGARHG